MLRRTGLALAWLGLSAATMVLSFSGCYGDVTQGTAGNCEDDQNPCTNDTCAGGTEQHTPAPGIECSLNNNSGTCNDMGRCVTVCEMDESQCTCTIDSQCPLKEDCGEWKCDTAVGKCKRNFINEGLAVGKQVDGDCKTVVCKAGEYGSANDDTDALPSEGCLINTCVGGTPSAEPAMLGKVCDSGACDGKGSCVDCLSAGDWASCGATACPIKMCNGETSVDAANCQSGKLADTVCCNSDCTEVCKSCNVMEMRGTCSNIPKLQPDPSYIPQGGGAPASCNLATAGAECNGAGQCLKVSGTQCQSNAQCISGNCNLDAIPMAKCLGDPGEGCFTDADCVSGVCAMGTCQ